VTLRISDSGPGIAPAALAHIFDKFVIGDDRPIVHGDGHQSTGLGLAIAKGIMEAHGGSIAAESPPGGGARFSLTFPRESEAA